MKKILSMFTCCCIIFALAACSQEAAPTQQPTTTQAPTTEATVPTTLATEPTAPISTAVYSAPLAYVSMPPITEAEVSGNTTLSYYAYPAMSVVLPDADVAEVVKLDLLNRIDATTQTAQTVHAAAKKDYSGQSDWYNYYMDVSYEVKRLDQNVLSVFGTEAAFDGSPNSTTIGVSANYDLSTGASLSLKSILFPDFSADILADLIVDGLNNYDETTLLPGYKEVIDQMFSTNVPVESWYFDNTGLCFYFAPYEIAPHSMGIIYSHVPYSSLSGLMKEAYFPMEDLAYSGNVEITSMNKLENNVLDAFDQFGELTIGEGGNKFLLTTNGSVLNLQIYEAYESFDGGNIIPSKMLFASAGMGPTHAVILDIPTETSLLYITYESNGETVSTKFFVSKEQ